MKNTMSDLGLLVLRLAAGGMLLFAHGLDKAMNWSTMSATFPDPLGLFGSQASLALAIFAELVCSALVMMGLVTRLAALPVIATMAVAAFIHHTADPFAKKELALLYLVAFVAIALLGPGKFSVATWLRNRRGK